MTNPVLPILLGRALLTAWLLCLTSYPSPSTLSALLSTPLSADTIRLDWVGRSHTKRHSTLHRFHWSDSLLQLDVSPSQTIPVQLIHLRCTKLFMIASLALPSSPNPVNLIFTLMDPKHIPTRALDTPFSRELMNTTLAPSLFPRTPPCSKLSWWLYFWRPVMSFVTRGLSVPATSKYSVTRSLPFLPLQLGAHLAGPFMTLSLLSTTSHSSATRSPLCGSPCTQAFRETNVPTPSPSSAQP